MEKSLSIGGMIKRYIKMRGHTLSEVAEKVDVNYKTFSGILNRDAVDAELLFKLAILLDMDLCWMAQLYGKHQPISSLERYQMSRMRSDLRNQETEIVLNCLDRHIKENPTSVTDIKSALLRDFTQLFYLLDVLLPEDYIIRITVERDREKYYCMPSGTQNRQTGIQRGGYGATTGFFEGHEMLKMIILERKEMILK